MFKETLRAGFAAALAGLCVVGVMGGSHAQAQTATDYTTYRQYDTLRRLTMLIGPVVGGQRRVEKYTYNVDGQLLRTDIGAATGADGSGFAAQQTVQFKYDALGNQTQVYTNPGASAATLNQISYDADDRPQCMATRMNPSLFQSQYDASDRPDACALGTAGAQGLDRITKTTYDAAAQPLSTIQALDTSDQRTYAIYTYTLDGKLATITDANGNLTQLSYDDFDRLSQQNFPSTARGAATASTTDYEQYGYDATGNRTSLRKRDGSYVRFCYDALNRETIKRPHDVADCQAAGAADDVYTTYDLMGQKQGVRFASTTGQGVVYAYDLAGRMISETTFGRIMSFAYDAAGERRQVTWPDGTTHADYAFDTAGHNTSITIGSALVSYAYDGLGRRSTMVAGSGANTHVCYDVADRPTIWGLDLAGGDASQTGTYDCALAAQRAGSGLASPGVSNRDQYEAYGYNPAGQVTSRAVANSLYVWAGYNANLTATADGLNRDQAIVTIGGGGCAATGKGYDCNGNLTNDGARTFGYDVENRLVSASGGASLAYDPLGRLYQTVLNGVTTQFLYDGDQLTAEYDAQGNLLRRYVHGVGSDAPLLWLEGSGVADVRYLHADRQGSIVAWSDASGIGQAAYTYGPYGEPGDSWGSGPRFRFTGQAALPELKLYHYKARLYDPARGWFLQTDPIGYSADLDLYAYVGDDPVNRLDPTGTTDVAGDCSGTSNCHVTIVQTVRIVHQSGGKTVVESTVKITTSFTVTKDANGKTTVSASSTVENAGGKPFSSGQLTTMGNIIGKMQQAGVLKGLGPNTTQMITAVGAGETRFGTAARGAGEPARKDPSINPMQLSGGRGNMDLDHNIQGGMDVLKYMYHRFGPDPRDTYKHFSDGGANTMASWDAIYNTLTERKQ